MPVSLSGDKPGKEQASRPILLLLTAVFPQPSQFLTSRGYSLFVIASVRGGSRSMPFPAEN